MNKFDRTKAIPEVHQDFIENIGCQITDVKMTDTVKCVQEKSVKEVMDKCHMFDECNSKYSEDSIIRQCRLTHNGFDLEIVLYI